MEHVGPVIHGTCGPSYTWNMWAQLYMEHVGPVIHGTCGPSYTWNMWAQLYMEHVGPVTHGTCGPRYIWDMWAPLYMGHVGRLIFVVYSFNVALSTDFRLDLILLSSWLLCRRGVGNFKLFLHMPGGTEVISWCDRKRFQSHCIVGLIAGTERDTADL